MAIERVKFTLDGNEWCKAEDAAKLEVELAALSVQERARLENYAKVKAERDEVAGRANSAEQLVCDFQAAQVFDDVGAWRRASTILGMNGVVVMASADTFKERDDAVYEMIAQGLSRKEIMRRTGLQYQNLCRILRKHPDDDEKGGR